MALPEELDRQMDALREQGWTILHLHEAGGDCDERCVPHKIAGLDEWKERLRSWEAETGERLAPEAGREEQRDPEAGI
jgi:hypothetical protein